jgi:PTH1 family peptidyl-tRNA hydrolase
MGLFDRKRTSFYDSQPYYTIGNERTLLIIGLGNPGEKYAANRHNIGFMALDRYRNSHDFSSWSLKKDLQAMVATGQVGSTRIILAKPTTFMNDSGEAAQMIQKFYRIYNQDMVVIYDDLDVDFGTIRTRAGGSAGTHNGVKSLVQHVGDDFGRVKVGIGPKKPAQMDTADFVLQDFSKKEQEKIATILRECSTVLDEITASGVQDDTRKVI